MSNVADIAKKDETPKEVPQETKKQSLTEMEAEMKASELYLKQLEIEAKLLEVKERKANVQDLEERLAERELKRENVKQNSLTNGATLKQLNANDKLVQARCNHKKGGNGAEGVVAGKGDDSQYAVFKHTFANGDTWIRCLRCAKTWKPVLREWFTTDEEYQEAVLAYKEALNFTTRNATSSSYMFRWSDGGKYYREMTRNTNLR